MNYSLFALLVFLFCLACFIQLFFLWKLRWRLAFNIINQSKEPVPVSIVICAKNEAERLQRFLPKVLEQEYPQSLFEVVVVDDQSSDNTATILSSIAVKYPQLKIVRIDAKEQKDLPGKKYALARGISAARFERLLLTDADCYPASTKWLRTMANHPKAMVLGYGAYEKQAGWLNRFIRWETLHTAMQYFSYAASGSPYMGVGRNLAYQKSLLQGLEHDDLFQTIYRQTPSGDDDLMVSNLAKGRNTGICLSLEAHTISLPQTTWKAWWRQKTRHSSVGKYYTPKVKAYLGAYSLSHWLYWFLGIPLLIYFCTSDVASVLMCSVVVVLFVLRLFLYWWNGIRWYRGLAESKLLWFYPLGDLAWAIYNVLLSPYIFFKNRQQWK